MSCSEIRCEVMMSSAKVIRDVGDSKAKHSKVTAKVNVAWCCVKDSRVD